MREPRAPVRPWHGRSTAGLGLWSWLRRRLCGCSPRCPCCCRRGKIKYFSFRSFTRFTSGERDAPESQVRLAPRGCWVPGARVGAGTGTRLCPVPCGAVVGQPGRGRALRARSGKVQEVTGQPALRRAVTPRCAGSWGCRLGLPRCWGRWVPCAAGDGTGTGVGTDLGQGAGGWGHLEMLISAVPSSSPRGRRGCTFLSDSSGRKGPDPSHPSQRWEQRDRGVLGRSSAAARDILGRQQLHGDAAAQGQGCSHCQELLGTTQVQQDQDSPGHSPVAGWAPESRGRAKRRAEEPEDAGSPAAG